MAFKDLTGQRFGRLVAIRISYRDEHRMMYWECICDCGNVVIVRGNNLTSGWTQSCGCLHRERTSIACAKRNFVHGLRDTKLYGIWNSMKGRCYNPKNEKYKNYGQRGIRICQRWLNSFENFYQDAIQLGYKEGLQIHRVNNNGHYEPKNVAFVTNKENCNAKSNNRTFILDNKTYTLAQLSEKFHIDRTTISVRLKYGWSIEEAVNTPVQHKLYEYRGEQLSLTQVAKKIGVLAVTLSTYLSRHEGDMEKAIQYYKNKKDVAKNGK